MLWVAVFGAVALGGLVMVALFTVSLAHKLADLAGEVRQLAGRAGRLADLVGQVRLPDPLAARETHPGREST